MKVKVSKQTFDLIEDRICALKDCLEVPEICDECIYDNKKDDCESELKALEADLKKMEVK
jgi:hypothetical protein